MNARQDNWFISRLTAWIVSRYIKPLLNRVTPIVQPSQSLRKNSLDVVQRQWMNVWFDACISRAITSSLRKATKAVLNRVSFETAVKEPLVGHLIPSWQSRPCSSLYSSFRTVLNQCFRLYHFALSSPFRSNRLFDRRALFREKPLIEKPLQEERSDTERWANIYSKRGRCSGIRLVSLFKGTRPAIDEVVNNHHLSEGSTWYTKHKLIPITIFVESTRCFLRCTD